MRSASLNLLFQVFVSNITTINSLCSSIKPITRSSNDGNSYTWNMIFRLTETWKDFISEDVFQLTRKKVDKGLFSLILTFMTLFSKG